MALARGGEAVDDPLTWWDSLPDEVIQFWDAYWRVEPFGAEWDRHAQGMVMLDALYAATVNPNLDRKDRYKPHTLEDFYPPDYYREKQPKAKVDIVAQLDAIKQRLQK